MMLLQYAVYALNFGGSKIAVTLISKHASGIVLTILVASCKLVDEKYLVTNFCIATDREKSRTISFKYVRVCILDGLIW